MGIGFVCLMFVWLLGIRKEGFNVRQDWAKRILGKGDDKSGDIQDHWAMESGKGLLGI